MGNTGPGKLQQGEQALPYVVAADVNLIGEAPSSPIRCGLWNWGSISDAISGSGDKWFSLDDKEGAWSLYLYVIVTEYNT